MNYERLSPHEMFYGSRPPLLMPAFFQPAYYLVPHQRKTDPGLARAISYISGTITGEIVIKCWMRRRGGSCTRTTSPNTTRKYRTLSRSGMRQWRHRGIFMSLYQNLCLSPRCLLHPPHLHQLPFPHPHRLIKHQPRRQRRHHQ